MAFRVSPGVSVAEIDLTTRIPVPSTSVGGFSGLFKWGPIEEIQSIETEDSLKEKFGKTDNYTYKSYLTCSSFLSYSNSLRVVRTANTAAALNATTSGVGYLIKNTEDHEVKSSTFPIVGTNFVVKYPGELGNSLKLSLCLPDRANTVVNSDGSVALDANTKVELTGLWDSDASSASFYRNTTNPALETKAGEELRNGDVIEVNGVLGIVTSITDDDTFSAIKYVDEPDTNNDLVNLFDENATTGVTIVRWKRSAFEESSAHMFGQLDISANSKTVNGYKTFFAQQLQPGDLLTFTDSIGQTVVRKIESITSDLLLTLVEPVTSAVVKSDYSREWEFRSSFQRAPLTSNYAYKTTGNKDTYDEIHLILVDEDGFVTGVADKRGFGTVKSRNSVVPGEVYSSVSVADGAVDDDGTQLFYKEVINNNSNYLYWADHSNVGDVYVNDTIDRTLAWGSTLTNGETKSFATTRSNSGFSFGSLTQSFAGGNDGNSDASDADLIRGYDLFKNPDDIDVSLIMTGEASQTLATYVINEICEYRKDCVAFVSPTATEVATKGQETTKILERRATLPSSSYAMMDGNYKYAYDRWSSVYRYIPLNGDIAGLCAQSDTINPYISPAGYTRGNVKNVAKLIFNPTGPERDLLYSGGVNPIISVPGGGTILFGDKTLLARPSAFDRINVRRLFIILEKAIANAAQFSLFEFNDEFTRASFISTVEPFLREVQGRRGIQDYKVICDTTNNPPSVVDRNEFRGDIFIKPTRSINFINLNFVAVASGVEFNEVVNAI
jgi:hypothetical protein